MRLKAASCASLWLVTTLVGCLLASSSDTRVSAYSPHEPPPRAEGQLRRRDVFPTAAAAAGILAVAPERALAGKYCAYGEGSDCQDLAEGNPFILELQRKSAAHKQANEASAKTAYYAKNYPDWFAAVGKTMVQKETDGTFVVVDDQELAKLWAEHKIAVQKPTTLGGRVTDVTQKPMLVLKASAEEPSIAPDQTPVAPADDASKPLDEEQP